MSDGNKRDSFLTSLGLAKRADKLVIGWDRIDKYSGHIFFIIVAGDASARTRKNAELKAETLLTEYAMETLGNAVGISRAAVIAVTDGNFANLLLKKHNDGIKQ